MICISLQNRNCEELFEVLDRPEVEMAEIRLDRCELSDEQIGDLFSGTDVPLIATCRIGGRISAAESERRLSLAIEAGAKYADLEIEAPAPMGKRLGRLCREEGTVFIRSYHDVTSTPGIEELREILSRCHRFGGQVAKIVTTARSQEDAERLKELYDYAQEGTLVSFAMGTEGRESRLRCLAWGSPFTYAALAEGEESAEGQMTLAYMADVLYGDAPCPAARPVAMPASKSFAQRAILCAALAHGTSHISGYSPCDDSESAIRVAKALGAEIHRKGSLLTIVGTGGRSVDTSSVDVGESGLLTRLLIPLLSAVCRTPVTVTGHGTLEKRPLKDANDIMAAFGVVLKNLGGNSRRDIFVPLQIDGSLVAGRADIPGAAGSQLISGLLMALPLCGKNSAVFVHNPVSIPYMFITTDVLRKFGVKVDSEMEGDEEFVETQDWNLCTAVNFKIKGGQRYGAVDIGLEGDWSAAAAFMVAGAVFGAVHLTGLDTRSLQADLSIMDVLMEAGASVSQDEDGTINVLKAPLSAFEVDLNNAPDLFPVTAVLACFCPGESRISGVGRLAGKECDRGEAIAAMLSQMGVDVRIEADVMLVRGRSLSGRLLGKDMLRGGSFTSHHDHRMVMALSVASLGADSPITIDDTQCVSKSFPDFLRLFGECFS